jgi:LmbE family N-acetylglucosaminyl deacetylase
LSPDLIFTPRLEDRHQDHRLTSEVTWQTFRDHAIFEYEIPKYEGDLVTPNFYVPLDRRIAQRKAREIVRLYGSQHDKHWFTEETFTSLLRLRGIECRAAGGYAEAFHCRKLVLGGGSVARRGARHS